MRSRLLALFAGVVCLLPLVSCASIPERSDPEPLKRVPEADASIPVTPPPPNLHPFGLVRSFVDTAAAPENNHDAARLHLAPDAQKRWQVPPELLIVDNVDTIPAARPPHLPENVQMIRLEADKVGWLRSDQSFEAEEGEYVVTLRVERQPQGYWRLADPPPDLVATRASFEEHYTPVQVYFLDRDWSGVVPDLRYVVSQPTPNLPRRVIDLLLSGPSEGFRGAMDTAIPPGVTTKTNPSEASDGALVVNLSDLKGASQEVRRLIAAQVVLSLQSVSNARVRLQEEGGPMLADSEVLRPTDVASFEADNLVSQNLPGLAIIDERVHSLDAQAAPTPGAAGSSEFDVVLAGQSVDGSALAAVVRTPNGVGLRVGPYGGPLSEVPVWGGNMSAPTWRSNSELWTVVDGHELMQIIDNGGGAWVTRRIDTREFSGGRAIQYLRLSHDGTRVAGLVDGQLVVAGVQDDETGTTLERPVVLTGGPMDSRLTAVAWRTNESLVATTTSGSAPVVEISVDGYEWKWYASLNINQPITALTVSPTHNVIVADRNGLWEVSNHNDVWSPMGLPISNGSIPFFPGSPAAPADTPR